MTKSEQENEYLKAYFEIWSLSDEYRGMTKREVKKHLEEVLQEYRILMSNLWGKAECAKMLGHPGGVRLENILTGNNTRH